MQVTAHPRLSVGVGLAAASVIAVSPFSAPTHLTHLPAIPAASDIAVALSAAYNPLQPWVDAFETAGADAKTLYKDYSATPAVLLQQILVNQVTHLKAVLKNPGSIGTVLDQVVKNVQAVVQAATLLGVDAADHPEAAQQSLDGWHDIMLQSIPKLMNAGTPTAVTNVVKEVLNVLSSPISGIAMGLIGPVASPVVALVNSATAIVHSLLAGHLADAVQSLINIPAKMVGAVLNGATANLNGLVPVLNKLGLLKDTTMHTLSLAFGGLFSTGVTGQAQTGIGGSIFNAIGMNVTTGMMGFPLTIDIQGRALGPIAALVSFGQIMAKALGWSGTGNPLKTATTSTATATSTAATADAGSATSIPSATTTGVTVSAAATTAATTGAASSETAAAKADSVDNASVKAATVKAETTKVSTADTTKSDGTASDTTSSASDSADSASTDTATKKSGKTKKSDAGQAGSTDSDATSSDSTKSDSTKSDSTKSDSAKHGSKHGSKHSSTKSDSAKAGSHHYGKSHASGGSRSR